MGETFSVPSGLDRRWLIAFDADELAVRDFDVLVIGSGIAGLTAALHASAGKRVALLTKARLTDSNTWLAQGGIAGAVGEADSVELHLADTLVVGQGLCDERVVHEVVAEAPEALAELQDFGMRFDVDQGGGVALAREGGHSLPRVLHSGDATGAAVQNALTAALRRAENVRVFEHRFLVDLVTANGRCTGALVLDGETGRLEFYSASSTVLATGGAGQVFRVTTNPTVATGDGVAAAWRAGAEIMDMEFVQFHPTALDHEAAPRFLVSEALRGEGAYLLDCELDRFMVGVHPLAELAPRDVVSRQIESVMARCGRENVWLDARHLGREYLISRFPTIWDAMTRAGYDMSADLVPVAPAAHYLIGGVKIDLDGRTSVPGLFASGEAAASGLHGANRLASNSLLEGLVFSRRIARVLEAENATGDGVVAFDSTGAGAQGPEVPASGGSRSVPGPDAAAARELVQAAAGRALGMGRTAEGMAEALRSFAGVAADVCRTREPECLEALNLATVASLMAVAALAREESRGCHSRLDHQARDDVNWRGHTVYRRGEPARFAPIGG